MGYFYNDSNGIIVLVLVLLNIETFLVGVLHVGVGFWQTHGF
jgi:hypothetical protein